MCSLLGRRSLALFLSDAGKVIIAAIWGERLHFLDVLPDELQVQELGARTSLVPWDQVQVRKAPSSRRPR